MLGRKRGIIVQEKSYTFNQVYQMSSVFLCSLVEWVILRHCSEGNFSLMKAKIKSVEDKEFPYMPFLKFTLSFSVRNILNRNATGQEVQIAL